MSTTTTGPNQAITSEDQARLRWVEYGVIAAVTNHVSHRGGLPVHNIYTHEVFLDTANFALATLFHALRGALGLSNAEWDALNLRTADDNIEFLHLCGFERGFGIQVLGIDDENPWGAHPTYGPAWY